MKYFSLYILIIGFCLGCKQQNENTIAVNGTIKNSSRNKIVLISFGASNTPIILDTATLDNNGKFTLKSLTNDEELYAIKVDSMQEIWFVNDTKEITINANLKEYKSYQTIGSTASQALHLYISTFDSLLTLQKKYKSNIDTSTQQKAGDSLIDILREDNKQLKKTIKDFCTNNIDKTKSPALKYFFLYYTNKAGIMDEVEMFKLTSTACKVHPKSVQLQGLKESLSYIVRSDPTLFLINEPAIDFNYSDTSKRTVSLKTFKGKYLLIDFWESSNNDYRKQIGYQIETYKQFKNKNFEILGVSLDSTKTLWQKAVKQDSTYWTQVNDSLGLKSSVAKRYYLSGTPYNVLISPVGKIIAVDIRNEKLREKLKELLK